MTPSGMPLVRRRTLRILTGVVVGLPLLGLLFEWNAARRDARRFPPAGILVDVGGRRLHLMCIGSGRPTVLFEASGFGNALSSSVVRTAVAKHARVCSYDRAGVGWSDPGPRTASVGMLAEDLRRLQEAAALETPFVIVTASFGGLVTEMFARRYPERVAGIVFLDAASSERIPAVAPMLESRRIRAACLAATAAGRLGVVRLFDPFRLRRSTSAGAARSAALMYGSQPWNALCSQVRGLPDTRQEFEAAPPVSAALPIIVLSAESLDGLVPRGLEGWGVDVSALLPRHHEFEERLARRSTRGSWRVVPGSGHLIADSSPQAVIEAVLEVLRQIEQPPSPPQR